MTITFITRKKFQEFLESLCYSSIEKFTASKFAKYASIGLDDSFKLLIEHVATKELELSWELRCPNCNRVLSLNSNKDLEEYECDFCCDIFDVDENDLFPKFQVTKEFKDYLIESNKGGNSVKKTEKAITDIPDKNIPISDINIDEETKKILQESTHSTIINVFNGGSQMNQISNSFNHSNLNNASIQSTHNSQIPIVPEEHVVELQDYINNIDDEVLRNMNDEHLKNFKESLKQHDKEMAKKYLAFIGKTIGTVSSISTIAGYLN